MNASDSKTTETLPAQTAGAGAERPAPRKNPKATVNINARTSALPAQPSLSPDEDDSAGKRGAASQHATDAPESCESSETAETGIASDKSVNRLSPISWPVLGVVFLTLLAVALIAPWLITQRSTQAIAGAQDAMQKQLQQIQTSLDALQAKIGEHEAQLTELKSQTINLERWYQESKTGGEEVVLLEVEHALTLAEQQLQLAASVPMALQALGDADARLSTLEHPRYIALRRVLGRTIKKLRDAPVADIAGMSLRLENALISVAHLPLQAYAREDNASPQHAQSDEKVPEDPGWLQTLWLEIRNLVQLRRVSSDAPPLLLPEQHFFLRANLKLRLLNARLALLSRDQWSFRSELDTAIDWLQQFFARDNPGVSDTIATLEQLSGVNIQANKLPDLNESFAALRLLQTPQATSGTPED